MEKASGNLPSVAPKSFKVFRHVPIRKEAGMARMEKRVLVVDDEESIGIGISEMLRDAGFDAKYVTSGPEAVKEVENIYYSLVFMDMVMPGMNGLETFRQIRRKRPETRVVLFTGFFKDADRAIFEGVKEGMIDVYIRKPFFHDEIVGTAARYA